jgi:hypothetical protein
MWFVLETMRSQAPFGGDLLHLTRDEGVDELRRRWRWNPEDDVSTGSEMLSG